MKTMTLAVTAILMTTASMTLAQPTRGDLMASEPAALSYRSQGGFVPMRMGLDVHPSGAAYAFQEVNGTVTRAWSLVSNQDLLVLQAAADAFFASPVRSASKGSGSLSHTVLRQTASSAQWFETSSPSGMAADLIQKLQAAQAQVLSAGSTLTSMPSYEPQSQSSPSAGSLGTSAGSGVSQSGASAGSLAGASSSTGGAASKGLGGTKSWNDRTCVVPDPQGKGMDRDSLQGSSPSAGSGSSMGSMQTGSAGPQIIVCPRLPGSKEIGSGGSTAVGSKGRPKGRTQNG